MISEHWNSQVEVLAKDQDENVIEEEKIQQQKIQPDYARLMLGRYRLAELHLILVAKFAKQI